LLRELRTMLAAAAHRRAENAGQRDAQERRSHVRAIIHVLFECAALASRTAAAAHEAYRIYIEQKSSGADFIGSFRIEDVRLAKRQVDTVQVGWILMKKVAKVSSRGMMGSERQEHRTRIQDAGWGIC
jgi:hypothetical protein